MRNKLQTLFGLFRLIREILWSKGKLVIHGYKYHIGKLVRFNVENKGCLDLGSKTWISDFSYISANGGKVTLGDNNFFNTNCRIISKCAVTIGDNNLFGQNVVIVDHDHRFDDPNELISKQGYTSSAITVGSNIWVGANVLICQGVSICDRVVVAGNAVVTRDITESGVYGGIPAKKIKDI